MFLAGDSRQDILKIVVLIYISGLGVTMSMATTSSSMEGCYHCKVVSPCLPYQEYNDRNKSMCIDHCVVDTDCAGIIFNRQTRVCQLYLGVRGCLKYMEYTDEQSYILTKDVSRNGCPLVSLSQLPQGILFDSILNETTVTTSGSCLRECFLHDQCIFASYSQSSGECKIVSPCSTVSCTHQISTEFETYKMGCTRDCGELDHPTNGYVNTSQGTISGDSAHYDCNAGYTRNGPELRVCNGTNGEWQPEQPACIVNESMPVSGSMVTPPTQLLAQTSSTQQLMISTLVVNPSMTQSTGNSPGLASTTSSNQLIPTALMVDTTMSTVISDVPTLATTSLPSSETPTTLVVDNAMSTVISDVPTMPTTPLSSSETPNAFLVDKTTSTVISNVLTLTSTSSSFSELPPALLVDTTMSTFISDVPTFATTPLSSSETPTTLLVNTAMSTVISDVLTLTTTPLSSSEMPTTLVVDTAMSTVISDVPTLATTPLSSTETPTTLVVDTAMSTVISDVPTLATTLLSSMDTPTTFIMTSSTLQSDNNMTPSTVVISPTLTGVTISDTLISETSDSIVMSTPVKSSSSIESDLSIIPSTASVSSTLTILPTLISFTSDTSNNLGLSSIDTSPTVTTDVSDPTISSTQALLINPSTVYHINVSKPINGVLTVTVSSSSDDVLPSVMPATFMSNFTYSTAVVTVSSNMPSTSETSKKPEPLYLVPCMCSTNAFQNLTTEEIIRQLVSDLQIRKDKTTAAIMKKQCMEDSRPSSASIGTLAIASLITCAGVIVIFDIIGGAFKVCPLCTQRKRKWLNGLDFVVLAWTVKRWLFSSFRWFAGSFVGTYIQKDHAS